MHHHLLVWLFFWSRLDFVFVFCVFISFGNSCLYRHTHTRAHPHTQAQHIMKSCLSHFTAPPSLLCLFVLVQANATLHEFANLRKYSSEWLDSSNYLVNSAQILGQTLPMLQVWKAVSSRTSPFYIYIYINIPSRHRLNEKKEKKSLEINFCGRLGRVWAAESWCCALSHPLSPPSIRIPWGIPLWRTSLRCRQTSMSTKWRRRSAASVSETFEGLTFL